MSARMVHRVRWPRPSSPGPNQSEPWRPDEPGNVGFREPRSALFNTIHCGPRHDPARFLDKTN